LMQQEFGAQDHGEQVGASPPTRNWMRGRWWFGDALAITASEFFTHVFDHFPVVQTLAKR
jgi:hypothetical protein